MNASTQAPLSRPSGRQANELRTVEFQLHPNCHAEGSVMACFGHTKVLCTASVEERTPPFIQGFEQGWLTAEYGMLPRSTHTRMHREAAKGKQSGRTQEIQRLIGRSLRAAMDLTAIPGHTVVLDCDVIQADGGTRTTAINGAYLALALALKKSKAKWLRDPLHGQIGAISVGIYNGHPVLDLDYAEDSQAETDMNIVMNDNDAFIEVQGTAEGHAFHQHELDQLLDLAKHGIHDILQKQRDILA